METKTVILIGGLAVIAYLVWRNMPRPAVITDGATAKALIKADVLTAGVNAVSNIANSVIGNITNAIVNPNSPNSSGIHFPTETNASSTATST